MESAAVASQILVDDTDPRSAIEGNLSTISPQTWVTAILRMYHLLEQFDSSPGGLSNNRTTSESADIEDDSSEDESWSITSNATSVDDQVHLAPIESSDSHMRNFVYVLRDLAPRVIIKVIDELLHDLGIKLPIDSLDLVHRLCLCNCKQQDQRYEKCIRCRHQVCQVSPQVLNPILYLLQ